MLRLPPAGLNLAPHLVGRRLVRTSLVVGIGAVLAACSSRPAGPVAIGLAGPFSQPRGASMLRAAQLAVNQINARHGIRGLPLELRIVDDSGSEDTAVRAAERLYADPTVVAVVGHLSSGPTIAAARVYGAGPNPVAMISPSASSPDLSGVSPWVFRVCPSDLQHGPELARFAWQTLGARRAGIIYLNNDYGRGVRGTFAAEFTRLGGDVVETDPYVAATPSLEPYLSRLRRGAGIDVLLVAGEPPGAELVLREMAALGVRWPVLGGDALTGIEAAGGGRSRRGCTSRRPIFPTGVTSATRRSWRITPVPFRECGPTIAEPGPTTPCSWWHGRSSAPEPTVRRCAIMSRTSARAGRSSRA